MVALELKRAVSNWNDRGLGRFSLHFIKNKEKQEVDFLVAESNQPVFLVEAKASDPEPTSALRKFQRALGVPAVQLTAEGGTYRRVTNGVHTILVAPAHAWLCQLP